MKAATALLLLLPATIHPGAAWARSVDTATRDAGLEIYRQHCAACHGADAEGQVPDWHLPGADGKMPAPPLNGTGHTWHHPLPALFRTIRDGTAAAGGSMPAHAGKLDEEQILSVIYWFTSQWPDELYRAWRQRHPQ